MMTPNPANGAISELAQVEDRDIPAALETMVGAPPFLSLFEARPDGCSRPLAWVSLALKPGEPAGTIRIQSGGYSSPIFELSEVPKRVAIPYPAAYESGHGTLQVLEVGGKAIVSLLPAWNVTGSASAREVVWHPAKRCVRP